jgi:hypothetical protein
VPGAGSTPYFSSQDKKFASNFVNDNSRRLR